MSIWTSKPLEVVFWSTGPSWKHDCQELDLDHSSGVAVFEPHNNPQTHTNMSTLKAKLQ